MRCLVLVLAVAFCTSGDGPPPSTSPTPRKNGNMRMAARLKQIFGGMSPLQNAFLNQKRVTMCRAELAKATDAKERRKLEMMLGYELLVAGAPEESARIFNTILQSMTSDGPQPERDALIEVYELLALSYLRIGELANCVARHSADSCLMPIAGSGVHVDQTGSRMAVQTLTELLKIAPENLGFRWLLNLAYMTLGEWPDKVPAQFVIPPSCFDSHQAFPRFFDVAKAAGVETRGMAGGTILDDFDNDGLIDLVSSRWGGSEPMRYFRNAGDGTFVERTMEADLAGQVSGLNIMQTDYNNDGWLDIFVLRGAWLREAGRVPNSLLRNNGDGNFEDVTEDARLLSYHPTQTAVWADFNNDGWLDVFIGNESAELPHPCELYMNNRDGTFTNVTAQASANIQRFVKGVACGDYNRDGLLDLYLSCLAQPNILLRNEGPGTAGAGGVPYCRFTDVTREAGVADPMYSFPTCFIDFDNDGWEDLYVASFAGFTESAQGDVAADYLNLPTASNRPHLYRNNRNGTFTDIARASRADPVLLAMGMNFGDIDNDGWLDIYAGTGQPALSSLVPNRMFRNVEGKLFNDVTTAGGFGHLQKGHGISFADIDNDGDQDIYACLGGAFEGDVFQNALYENPGFPDHHWITLMLEGVQSNRAAIGASVRVTVAADGAERDVYVKCGSGASFGASSLQQEIGLGRATAIRQIEVSWPASRTGQVFKDVAMDAAYRIREGDPAITAVPRKAFKLGGANAADRPECHEAAGQ